MYGYTISAVDSIGPNGGVLSAALFDSPHIVAINEADPLGGIYIDLPDNESVIVPLDELAPMASYRMIGTVSNVSTNGGFATFDIMDGATVMQTITVAALGNFELAFTAPSSGTASLRLTTSGKAIGIKDVKIERT